MLAKRGFALDKPRTELCVSSEELPISEFDSAFHPVKYINRRSKHMDWRGKYTDLQRKYGDFSPIYVFFSFPQLNSRPVFFDHLHQIADGAVKFHIVAKWGARTSEWLRCPSRARAIMALASNPTRWRWAALSLMLKRNDRARKADSGLRIVRSQGQEPHALAISGE